MYYITFVLDIIIKSGPCKNCLAFEPGRVPFGQAAFKELRNKTALPSKKDCLGSQTKMDPCLHLTE